MATPFLGEVKMISWNYAPRGWAFCNGQLLPINQNQALFSLLGTNYGGNGTQNFALPDLRGRTPIHFGNGFVQGQRAGEENHTLTQTEMPAHTHSLNASSNTADQLVPTGNLLGSSSSPLYGTITNQVSMISSSLTSAGGSQAHSNMQPYLVVNFIVALQGIFPSRN